MSATLEADRWIEVDCALCGSSARRTRFRVGRHSVHDCQDCGLVYVSPQRVAEALIEEVYDASYWRSQAPRQRGYADYAGDEDLSRRTWRARLRALEPHMPPCGRALDVGCASGLFLEELALRGWMVAGTEPSAPMRERAAQRLGEERVHAARLDQLELDREAYDLITLWDVIEHLSQPLDDLRRLRRALRPEGRLVLLTQDVSSLLARLIGRRWHHFKHDEHLHHFSPATLRRALEQCGFRVLHRTRRATGKWVRWSFVVERTQRLGRPLAGLLARLPIDPTRALHVNPMDEMLVVAERTEG